MTSAWWAKVVDHRGSDGIVSEDLALRVTSYDIPRQPFRPQPRPQSARAATASRAADELDEKGFALFYDAHTEPRGQTVVDCSPARVRSPASPTPPPYISHPSDCFTGLGRMAALRPPTLP